KLQMQRVEAICTNIQHANSFLHGLFEVATQGHHLSYRFHFACDLIRNESEFLQVPTRHFYRNVVECRLEVGTCYLSNCVAQFRQGVSQCKLCRDEGQRVSGSLRCKCRATA